MQEQALVCTHLFTSHALFMAQDFTRVLNHLHFHWGLIIWCRTNYSMHRPDRRRRGRRMCGAESEHCQGLQIQNLAKMYGILNSLFARRRRTFLPFVCSHGAKPYTIPARLRMKREGSIRAGGNECQCLTTWACRV